MHDLLGYGQSNVGTTRAFLCGLQISQVRSSIHELSLHNLDVNQMKRTHKNQQSLRLPNYNYYKNGAYFITICIKNKECLLGDIEKQKFISNSFGRIITDTWYSLAIKYEQIELDEFIVMPNHIHGIIKIDNVGIIHELSLPQNAKQRRKMLLPKAIGYFKMNSAKKINQIRQIEGISLWQKNYYEHIIRNEKSLHNIRQYIINNPARWSEDIENNCGKPNEREINFWQSVGYSNPL